MCIRDRDNQVGQILFMKDLPADLGDDLISVLSDLSIDMTITLHIESCLLYTSRCV